MRKWLTLICLPVFALFCVSCSATKVERNEDEYASISETAIEIIDPSDEIPKPAVEWQNEYVGITFEDILFALAAFEQSNFSEINKELIEWPPFVSSLLIKCDKPHSMQNAIKRETRIMYVLYDINSDGLPELILGELLWDHMTIKAVYSLQNGVPALLVHPFNEDWLAIRDGVITHEWGGTHRSGGVVVYAIGESGILIEKGGVYHTVWYHDVNHEDYEDLDDFFNSHDDEHFYFRGGFIGEPERKTIPITKEEYRTFRTRYVTLRVDLDWRSVSERGRSR